MLVKYKPMRKVYQLYLGCWSGFLIRVSASLSTPAVGGHHAVTLTGVSEGQRDTSVWKGLNVPPGR